MPDSGSKKDDAAQTFRDATSEIDRLKESIAGLGSATRSLDELTEALAIACDASSKAADALEASANANESATAQLTRFEPDRILSEMISLRERVVAEADRTRDALGEAVDRLDASVEQSNQHMGRVRRLVFTGFVIVAVWMLALTVLVLVAN